MHYDLTTLPNGLRIITQQMRSVRSIAIGCWVDAGSRDEQPVEAGASHFLEHLLFKGSDRHSARAIAEAFDAVGARNNAFTSKEYTCYWARLRSADLPLAVDILAEMLQRPAFRQEEIDSERNVVLEEINMNEDDPTDVAHEQFVAALWGGHPLAPPILGTKDSITAMTRDTIHGYWSRRYTPRSTVVAAVGDLDHDALVALVVEHLSDWEGPPLTRSSVTPAIDPTVKVRHRDTEQSHIVFGTEGLSRGDDRRFAVTVSTHVLGGGMSSRLFREIREDRGLAYAVHAFRMPFLDTGAAAIYAGTTPNQTFEVLKLIRLELDKLMSDGITQEELDRAKGNIKGSLALSLEDTNGRMTQLGRQELTGVEHLSVDEIVARIEALEQKDILDAARHVFAGPYVLGLVGPFEESDLEEFVQ
ncbi:MAG: pitrilysin family protein, partial [Actinomycetota bacterium]|nr:pitrilysin family protein [Actinomycetota bacterium]